MANTFYNEILIDHNQNPYHKHPLPGANMTLEGVNPSCGDDIVLQLRVVDGVIQEGSFEGDGCAISGRDRCGSGQWCACRADPCAGSR